MDHCRIDQWRIQDFPEGGAWTLQGGREHAKFSRKLHELERIWTPRGGRASLTPPLDPPMLTDQCCALGVNGSHSSMLADIKLPWSVSWWDIETRYPLQGQSYWVSPRWYGNHQSETGPLLLFWLLSLLGKVNWVKLHTYYLIIKNLISEETLYDK